MKLQALKKDEKTMHIAMRVTRSHTIDWVRVFGKNLCFALQAFEVSTSEGPHTHSAITFVEALNRDQIMNRIRKHYPDIKGNASYSLGKWDNGEEYLRYICKDIYKTYERPAGYKILNMDGQPPIYWSSARQLNKEYWLVNNELKEAGKAQVAKSANMSEFIEENLKIQFPHPLDREKLTTLERRELIVNLCLDYFKTTGKSYHGNDAQFKSFLNSVEHKCFHDCKSYHKYFFDKFRVR